MKKLLLILLCLPLLFNSCSKPEGCIEGNCIDGYGKFEDYYSKYDKKYKGTNTNITSYDLLWQLENNITPKDWVGTFIITEEKHQKNVELYNGARPEQKPGKYSKGTYVGEFKDRKFHGKGIFTYDNGSKYIGEWRDGKKNGKGTFKNSKGTYVGEFKDGEFCGKGTFTYKGSENKDEESGNWKDGKLNGYGTRIWSKDYDETHQGKYIGNFRNGKRDGYGTNWYSWGDYFKGNFDCCSKRNPTQEGTIYRLDGTSEYGTWETVTEYKRRRK